MAVAVGAAAIGIAFDAGAGDKELTTAFNVLYVLGCVVAVLAARQSAVFTAVVQPPLILFGAVPGAYWLFRGGSFNGLKGLAINCGYPLIDRFPLMLFTAAAVLLIGMARWYFGMITRPAGARDTAEDVERPQGSAVVAKLASMISAALHRDPAHAIGAAPRRPRRTGERTGRPGERPRRRPAAGERTGRTGAGRTRRDSDGAREQRRRPAEARRTRPARPPADDRVDERYAGRLDERYDARPPRRRPADDDGSAPRRRPRPDREGQPAARTRRQPHTRTGRTAARTGHNGRANPYRPAEPPEAPQRRAASARTGGDATHHPVSRVRYRSEDTGAQPRPERRRPSRESDNDEPDAWRYDI